MSYWTKDDAILLCRKIEEMCPQFGCHVALTGGCLYKDGERKDLDILFYRIRQVDVIDMDGLFKYLESVGVIKKSGFGWCFKLVYGDKNIDAFFPEEESGEYVRQSEPDPDESLLPW